MLSCDKQTSSPCFHVWGGSLNVSSTLAPFQPILQTLTRWIPPNHTTYIIHSLSEAFPSPHHLPIQWTSHKSLRPSGPQQPDGDITRTSRWSTELRRCICREPGWILPAFWATAGLGRRWFEGTETEKGFVGPRAQSCSNVG